MKITLRSSVSHHLVDTQRSRHEKGVLYFFRDNGTAFLSVGLDARFLDLNELLDDDGTPTEKSLRAEIMELKATISKYADGCDPKLQLARILARRAERLARTK
jgi:hypothetical protein